MSIRQFVPTSRLFLLIILALLLGVLQTADPQGANAQVVATGDELAGTVVTALRFGQQGLNDRGQVAFWALSLDGTEKIYRATPDPK